MNKELKNWQKLDSEHHLHPFTDHGELAEKGTHHELMKLGKQYSTMVHAQTSESN